MIIGGLALSYWSLPRHTQDIDVLFLNKTDIPLHLDNFKRTRDHGFIHLQTHVEVEVLDAECLKLKPELVDAIIKTAHDDNGIKVASKSGLVASKLSRFSRQDQADIENLIKLGGVDLSEFPLTPVQLSNFKKIKDDL